MHTPSAKNGTYATPLYLPMCLCFEAPLIKMGDAVLAIDVTVSHMDGLGRLMLHHQGDTRTIRGAVSGTWLLFKHMTGKPAEGSSTYSNSSKASI